jgi:hypothetical protein
VFAESSLYTGRYRSFLLSDDADRRGRVRANEIPVGTGWSLDFTSTCLTSEAFVGVEESSIPLLRSSVAWLINNQYRTQEGSSREVMW